MKRRLPPLRSLQVFDAVARLKSFRLAAEEIGVSPTAISHQIRLLESLLEVGVLERTPRKVELTADGKILQRASSQAFRLLQNAVSEIVEVQRPRVLTLTATTAMITHWLVPRLPALLREFPTIDLRLHADDCIVDLRSRNIDMALRYGAEPDKQLSPRLLYRDRFVLVSSPKLALTTAEDILQATLLHTDGRRVPQPAPNWQRWRDEFGPAELDINAGPRFTDETHVIQAAIAGQGVAIVSDLMAEHALRNGLLYTPLNNALSGSVHYFVSNPEGNHHQIAGHLAEWLSAEMAHKIS